MGGCIHSSEKGAQEGGRDNLVRGSCILQCCKKASYRRIHCLLDKTANRFVADTGILIIDKNFITSKNNCSHLNVTNAVGSDIPAENERFRKMTNGNIFNSEAEFLLQEENK
jgi:hypothetical protein